MDVWEIIRIVVISGLVLIALPFPIVLVAAAVAFAAAGFVAIRSWLGFREELGAGPRSRPRTSSARRGSAEPFG